MNGKYIGIGTLLLILVGIGIILINQLSLDEKQVIDQNDSIPKKIIYNGTNRVILDNIVDANNLFAQDLYNKYKDKDQKNMFFSPYSISSALAMTYEGAKGDTAEEMQSVLHLPSDKEKLRLDFSNINDGLNKAEKNYKLSIANSLWSQKDYPFLEGYFSDVEKYYGGKATNLDFVKDTENSRITINKWVEEKTNDRIKDLIPKGSIDKETRLVLTNAIYFKANWSSQFQFKNTNDQKFNLSNGDKVDIKMMHQLANFNYYENTDIKMLEMDYKGDDLSMLIILPNDNNISKIENSFTSVKLNEWKNASKPGMVEVSLPKFKFETKYFMGEDLVDMGMPTAFDKDNADFTGMYDKNKTSGNIYISQVIHQTFIEVAEYGTEAAAATAVLMGETTSIGTYEPAKIFNADHPFMFIIQEKKTGNILFMGRVSDPSK